MNVLDGLTMLFEYVDAYDCVVELGVGRLNEVVVDVLLVVERVEAFKDELEQSFEIFGRWRGDEYVGVAIGDCGSHR